MNLDMKHIIAGDYADPSILCDNGKYYAIFSSFIYNPGLLIWESDDLLNWEPLGHPLSEPVGDIWASTLIKFDDKYYIYFPCDFEIYVIVADKITGPWSKPKALGLKHAIDPGPLMIPETGEKFLFMDAGQVVKLSDDGLSVVTEKKVSIEPWEIPDEWDIEGVCTEGPKPFYKNGYVYMILTEGGTAGPGTGHMSVLARSKSPYGPWEYSPYGPMIRAESFDEDWLSIGHASYIEAYDGKTYLVFHGYEKGYYTLGRQPLLVECEWTEDGWIKACEGSGSSISIVKQPDYSDDFSADSLGLLWSFTHCIPEYSVGNGLEMAAGTISVNQGYHSYTYETAIDLDKLDKNTIASLILHYGNDFTCGISTDGNYVFTNFNGASGNRFEIPNECTTLYLRIKNDKHIVSAYYSFDGVEYIKYKWGMNTEHCTHLAYGKFLSLRPGMRVDGEGKARFEYFNLH